ncbi:MAG: HAD-IA family hydrolase [Acidimicrobiales bacterium]
MTAIVAAIFDLDGLLADSEPIWHAAQIDVFARYGLELTPELCRTTKGMFVGEVTRHWYGRQRWAGPGPDDVAVEIVDAVAALMSASLAPMPGVEHAVAFCRRRVQMMAVASSSPLGVVELALERLGIRGVFEVVHSAEHEPAGKPDPAVFLSAAALLGVEPGRCVVFEDSPAGVAAATAAGMECIAVPERGNPDGALGIAASVPLLASLEALDQGVWDEVSGRVATRSAPRTAEVAGPD